MKKLLTIITSALLCAAMLILSPAQVVASAADKAEKYISEVKVGMGTDSAAAAKELLEEGYTILADDKGNYADLNKDAGSKSALAPTPRQKVVYLGYKTTGEASDAITDLAVMKMDGGYSYSDYEQLMQDHMNVEIKPFVDRFIATLTEYRENLAKPKDSLNYKRANYYRSLLNKLTDDDTGGKPLGDLLVNETKYEMGDDAYNKLSDEEKKNHCDILTLLMQGKGQAIQLMETELTKASDSSDNTWLDRFLKTDLDKLTETVKKENPGFTPTEINKELDKEYYDAAKKIREKWSSFREILINTENDVEIAESALDMDEDFETIQNKVDNLDSKSSKDEMGEAIADMMGAQTKNVESSIAAENVVVKAVLEATNYGNGKLLDFFTKNITEFASEKGIRKLYPIVDALSAGQIAGLDFLSLSEMISMAIADENGFDSASLDHIEPASVFQDVNREIYEPGGVAITKDATRKQASLNQPSTTFGLSILGKVLISCTAACALASIVSGCASSSYKGVIADYSDKVNAMEAAINENQARLDEMTRRSNNYFSQHPNLDKPININQLSRDNQSFFDSNQGDAELAESIEKAQGELAAAKKEYAEVEAKYGAKSTFCHKLAVGFAVVMAILAVYSIVTTIADAIAYYRVDFAPIPKYMVEATDISTEKVIDGKTYTIMKKNETAYYKVVPCNRTDGGNEREKKNYKVLLDRNDLNGDVAQQWLALYSVKYKDSTPILADSLKVKMGDGLAPEGYSTGIHMFGDSAAQNLTSTDFCYNDPYKGTYVYFKRDAAAGTSAVASIFSSGPVWISGIIGLIVGAGVTLLIVKSAEKRKKKKTAQV